MPKQNKINPENVSPENALKDFLAFKFSAGLAPSTYNIRLRNLRAFFNYCCKHGHLTENPMTDFQLIRTSPIIVNIDPEDLKKLLAVPDKTTFVGLRDYALILLALDTGIRPKEALTLQSDDICLKTQQITIRATNSKTRVSRTLPISPQTAQAIRKLLAAHHPAWDAPVFSTNEGNPVNRTTWSRRLFEYSKEIEAKIRPYDLRHCFALYFLRNGGDVFTLQKLMGHSDIKMTANYLALTNTDLQTTHSRCSPLNDLTNTKHRKIKL